MAIAEVYAAPHSSPHAEPPQRGLVEARAALTALYSAPRPSTRTFGPAQDEVGG